MPKKTAGRRTTKAARSAARSPRRSSATKPIAGVEATESSSHESSFQNLEQQNEETAEIASWFSVCSYLEFLAYNNMEEQMQDIFEQFGQVPAFPLLSPLVQSTQLKALDGILKQPDARQILSSFTEEQVQQTYRAINREVVNPEDPEDVAVRLSVEFLTQVALAPIVINSDQTVRFNCTTLTKAVNKTFHGQAAAALVENRKVELMEFIERLRSGSTKEKIRLLKSVVQADHSLQAFTQEYEKFFENYWNNHIPMILRLGLTLAQNKATWSELNNFIDRQVIRTPRTRRSLAPSISDALPDEPIGSNELRMYLGERRLERIHQCNHKDVQAFLKSVPRDKAVPSMVSQVAEKQVEEEDTTRLRRKSHHTRRSLSHQEAAARVPHPVTPTRDTPPAVQHLRQKRGRLEEGVKDPLPEVEGYAPSKRGRSEVPQLVYSSEESPSEEEDVPKLPPSGYQAGRFNLAAQQSPQQSPSEVAFQPNVPRSPLRIYWTSEEVQALIAGVKKHGAGKWAVILADNSLKFNRRRTNVDLKDKWRNLQKQGIV